MTTNFPGGIDDFENPTGDTSQAKPRTHSLQHSDANDAIVAVQTKVGVDDSSDAASLDFGFRVLRSSGTLAGLLPPVPYVEGLAVDVEQFTVAYQGAVYQADPSAVPFETGFTFDPAQWRVLEGVSTGALGSDKGASMVGYSRSLPSVSAISLDAMFDAMPINLIEYQHHVSSRPTPDPATWDWAPAFDAAAAYIAGLGQPTTLRVKGRVGVARTVVFVGAAGLDTSEGEVVALPGFAAATPVLQFGTSAELFTGYNREINVDCANQRVVAVQLRNHRRSFTPRVRFRRTTYVGLEAVEGFGSNVQNVSGSASAKLSGDSINADYDSIGLLIRSSDCSFGTGDISCFGTGLQVIGNNNSFHDFHVWGAYQREYGESTCPMLFGIRNEGQANTFNGCIADSPSMLNYASAPSLSNGGYGIINRANGFQSKFIGCNVFVPDRRPLGETMPTGNRIIAFQSSQATNWIACEATDYTDLVLNQQRYQGNELAVSVVISRAEMRLYSVRQPLFGRKPFFSKGIEFAVNYVDPDEQAATFGACGFAMPNRALFQIVTNYEGDKQTVRLPRIQRGNTTFRNSTLTPLLTSSDSYTYWDTSLGKPVFWSGTGWVDATGAAV